MNSHSDKPDSYSGKSPAYQWFKRFPLRYFPSWISIVWMLLFAGGYFEDLRAATELKWVTRPSGVTVHLNAIAYGNGAFVVVGDNATILTSTDGEKWTPRASGINNVWRLLDVTFGNNKFVAIGEGNTLITSTDGTGWRQETPSEFYALKSVVFGGSKFVAVGNYDSNRGTGTAISSSDGTKWTYQSEGLDKTVYDLAFGNNIFVAVGNAGVAFASNDGIHWTKSVVVSGGRIDLKAVAFGDGKFVTIGYNTYGESQSFYSIDGLNWKVSDLVNPHSYLEDIAYGNGMYVVVGGVGLVSGSSSGTYFDLGWTTDTKTDLIAVTAGNGSFVAVGKNGIILQPVTQTPPVSEAEFTPEFGGTRDNPYTYFDADDQAPKRIGLPEWRVNTASLNLVLEGTVFYQKTVTVPIALSLTYNSAVGLPVGLFGKGWKLNYESTIIPINNTQVMLYKTSHKSFLYTATNDLNNATPSLPIVLIPPKGVFDQLTCYGNYFLLRDKTTHLLYRYERATNAKPARLVSIMDLNGNSIRFTVDLNTGSIQAITDPANRKIAFTYDSNNHACTRITVPDLRHIDFVYDTSTNLVRITDMNGYIANYQYTTAGSISSLSVEGQTTTFTYSPRPGVKGDQYITTVSNKTGGLTRYELVSHDSQKAVIKRLSPRGPASQFKSEKGLTSSIADPIGKLREIGYADQLPVIISDNNGKTNRLEYDAHGNVIKATDALNQSHLYIYDGHDNLIRHTTPLNETWNYTYDNYDHLIEMRSPLLNVINYTYDNRGLMTSYIGLRAMNGTTLSTTTFEHDIFGNVIRITDPLNYATTFTYDPLGLRCTEIVDARGNIKRLSYDNNDRLLSIVYAAKIGNINGGIDVITGSIDSGITETVTNFCTITNIYDAFGQTALRDERGNMTRVERNEFGYITQRTDPLGNVTRYQYDAHNNITNTINAIGKNVSNVYDDADRLIEIKDALGYSVTRQYNSEGNLIALIDKRNNKTVFTYDLNQRLLTTTDPLGYTVSYTRDALGRISNKKNARGQFTSFHYNAEGRIIRKDYGGAATTLYYYDNSGNLIKLQDPTGQYEYTYNVRNELTSIRYPNQLQMRFYYNGVGNLTRMEYPDGTIVNYNYDPFNRQSIPLSFRNAPATEIRASKERPNRVISMAWNTNSVKYLFDVGGNLKREIRSNGLITEYAYDDGGQPTNLVHKTGNTNIITIMYQWNAIGFCTNDTILHPLEPPLPVPTENTVSYNPANQFLKWSSGDAYTYDNDGNTTFQGNTNTRFDYDQENHLIEINRNTNAVYYDYSGNGDRVRKRVGNQTVNFHYGTKGNLLFESDGSGTASKIYLYNDSRLVASGTKANGFQFYHYDKIGNTLALSDANGQIISWYAYNPFGLYVASGQTNQNPFTFVGAYGVIDEGTGLFFMRNRFYDATKGRFIQCDPIGFDGGINLYTYTGNNPVNRIDPLGLFDPIFDNSPGALDRGRLPMPLQGTQQEYNNILKLVEEGKLSDKQFEFIENAWNKANDTLKREAMHSSSTDPLTRLILKKEFRQAKRDNPPRKPDQIIEIVDPDGADHAIAMGFGFLLMSAYGDNTTRSPHSPLADFTRDDAE